MTDTQTPQAPSRSLAPRLIGAAALLCVALGVPS